MYRIFDIALDCDILLPELEKVVSKDVVINVKIGQTVASPYQQPTWFHHWYEPGGNINISCAKLDDSYLLRFPGFVDFIISRSCDSIQYFPEPDVAQETVRHLLLDQVVPRILGNQGRFILHASAVQFKNGKVAAFLGKSGAGKSTLASALQQRGAHLITDDCLLLEQSASKINATPNYYGVRLFDDSLRAIYGEQTEDSPVAQYTCKRRIPIPFSGTKNINSPRPVDALFLLGSPMDKDNAIQISTAGGSAELMKIIGQSFLLDVSDKLLMKKQFKNIGLLIKAGLGIYNLSFPRQYELLPKVCTKVIEVLD